MIVPDSERRFPQGQSGNGLAADKETLYFLGGAALMLFGAGLVRSNPVVRKYMGQMGVGNLAKDFMPDIDRYLKLRSM